MDMFRFRWISITLVTLILLAAIICLCLRISLTNFQHYVLIRGSRLPQNLEYAEELVIRKRLEEAEATWIKGRVKINQSNIEYLALQLNPWIHPNVRSFWDFFYPNFDCPHITQRVGRLGDGGKWVCGLKLLRKKKPCVVYSYGISSEMSFEEEILQQTNCDVYMYDHSVQSKNVYLLKRYPGRATFYQIGIGVNNTSQFKTLKNEMDKHHHDFIDVLKMDVEGAEYKSLAQVKSDFPQGFPFAQLLVELHTTAFPNAGKLKQLRDWYQMLENNGLRAFKNEPNFLCLLQCFEFAFINTAVDSFLLHAYRETGEIENRRDLTHQKN